MSENEKEEGKACTFFRKPRKGGRGMRKRKGSSEDDEEDESAVVKVQKKKNRNPMVQTSGENEIIKITIHC